MDEIARRLAEVGQRLKTREDAREKAIVYQFPLWPEAERGIPNDLVRSALFTARKQAGTEHFRDKEIFAQNGITITYTGLELTQDHLDVYEGIMHRARGSDEDSTVTFSAHGLLKQIGRSTGGKDHKRLRTALRDLTATSIEIRRAGKRAYWGSLLPEGSEDEREGRFVVVINRTLIKFFQDGYAVINSEARMKLARSPLARHLQGWLASHAEPFDVSVQYLYRLTGSRTKELKAFRQCLKGALDRLVEVGVLDGWLIDGTDKVVFNPSRESDKKKVKRKREHV